MPPMCMKYEVRYINTAGGVTIAKRLAAEPKEITEAIERWANDDSLIQLTITVSRKETHVSE